MVLMFWQKLFDVLISHYLCMRETFAKPFEFKKKLINALGQHY